ncbi:MAG: hypothetical protein RR359_03320 [Bacilli bacterium]
MEKVRPTQIRPIKDYVTNVSSKNVLKVGAIGKSFYIVNYSIMSGEEIIKIHTFKQGRELDIIEEVPQEIVKDFFNQMTFF